jgi:hypothetical protein
MNKSFNYLKFSSLKFNQVHMIHFQLCMRKVTLEEFPIFFIFLFIIIIFLACPNSSQALTGDNGLYSHNVPGTPLKYI